VLAGDGKLASHPPKVACYEVVRVIAQFFSGKEIDPGHNSVSGDNIKYRATETFDQGVNTL
jgi:hypothetical protein